MPKRSSDEKIQRYRKKLRKLEEQTKVNRRRLVIDSSESDVDKQSDIENNVPTRDPDQQTDTRRTDNEPQNPPELDPEILVALGEPADEAPMFGAPIHENLAERWGSILKKGIAKEIKQKLIKEYPIPENCTLLQAPKLNAEISAAVTDMSRNRDKKMETTQQQLGVGITAINRALSLLLTSDDKVAAIKLLSDGCRILCDLHFMETRARTKLLTPGLDKSFLNIIIDTERDESLFGLKLSEKIKASKVIEKQGLQIKKTVTVQKPPTSTVASTVTRPRFQENWAGPSRFPPNRRGGRGARKSTFTNRRAPAPQSKVLNQDTPRAPTQQ